MRLSVALIVCDEEDVLADTLASVQGIADQIVVLDTGSTDETVAIARQHGALVGQMPWSDDFAAARNECMKLANGNWLLWLDAGEQLDADTAAELREFIDREADQQLVYTLMVEMPSVVSSATAEQILQPRLMPAGAKLLFTGRVRESVRMSMDVAGLTIGAAPGRIVRHARENLPARKTNKAQRDVRLASIEAAELGRWTPRLFLVAGESYITLGASESAVEIFRQAIAAAPADSTELLEAYYGLMTALDRDPGAGDELLATCLEALHRFPFDAHLLLAMGHYLQLRQRPDMAIRAFEAVVRFGKVNGDIWHLKQWKSLAATCLQRLRQPPECGEDVALLDGDRAETAPASSQEYRFDHAAPTGVESPLANASPPHLDITPANRAHAPLDLRK